MAGRNQTRQSFLQNDIDSLTLSRCRPNCTFPADDLLKSITIPHIIATLLFVCGCSPNKYADEESTIPVKNDKTIRDDFKRYFDSCGVEGSTAIYETESKKWIVSDTAGLKIETLPASTFKIVNLLIALETNTIHDENEIVRWVGSTETVKYGCRPEIYHDMPV